jgi:hypothetical protein
VFGLRFGNSLPEWVLKEFENLVAGLRGFLLQSYDGEHLEDGSHGDIHATSVNIIAPAGTGAVNGLTITDEVGGASVFSRTSSYGLHLDLGPAAITAGYESLHIESPNGGVEYGGYIVRGSGTANGPGITINYPLKSAASADRTWNFLHEPSSRGSALVWSEITTATGHNVLRLRYEATTANFTLCPDSVTRDTIGKEINLGSVDFTSTGEHFDRVYGLNVYARTALYERARTTPMGEWTVVAFNAADFTAIGAMTWTVASGDLNSYTYTLWGKTMLLAFKISTSTVGGVANSELRIAIPGGYVVATNFTTSNPIAVYQGAWVQGWAEAASAEAYIRLYTPGFGAANWVLGVDTTYVQGQITFRIA